MKAAHIRAEAAIITKNGLSVDFADFDIASPGQTQASDMFLPKCILVKACRFWPAHMARGSFVAAPAFPFKLLVGM
jgi:hypothetical protein